MFDAIRFLSLTANHSLLESALRVRDDAGQNSEIRGLFHRIGSESTGQISFEAEMIVPPQAVDDLGQAGKATTTFLRYSLVIRLRSSLGNGAGANPLEIIHEKLEHIKKGDAHEHLLFDRIWPDSPRATIPNASIAN